MGFEPIVNCRHCDDPLDVFLDYENRFCESCEELRNTPHECSDCHKIKTGIDGHWIEHKYGDFWRCHDCQDKEDDLHTKGDAMASLAEDQSIKAASYLMDAINGRTGNPGGRAALKEILQAAVERQR